MNDDKDPLLDEDLDDFDMAADDDADVEEQQDELQDVLDSVEAADPLPSDEAADEAADAPDEVVEEEAEEASPGSDELVAALSDDNGYLKAFEHREELTVVEFRQALGLADEARFILDTLIGQGLVERSWRRGKGRYTLTDSGKALLSS